MCQEDWTIRYSVYCGSHTEYFYGHEYDKAKAMADKFGTEVKPARRRICQ